MITKGLIIIGFCFLFWFICYQKTGDDEKNMLGFRSYPKEVQERVYHDPQLSKLAPKEIYISKVFFQNIVLFTITFLIVGVILKYTLGFNGFLNTFLYFLLFGQVMNLFDLVVIDLLWFRNTTRIRFSCAPEKELYQNPRVQIDSFLRGIVMFAIPAIIVSVILFLLP